MNTLKAIRSHITDWLEAYLWPIIALVAVVGAAHLYYSLTGRPPSDPPDFIPNLSGRFVLLIVAILATSIAKEAFIGWRKDGESDAIVITRIAAGILLFALCVFALLH